MPQTEQLQPRCKYPHPLPCGLEQSSTVHDGCDSKTSGFCETGACHAFIPCVDFVGAKPRCANCETPLLLHVGFVAQVQGA